MDCTTVRLVDGGYMKIKVTPELAVSDILIKVLRKVSPESVQKGQCSAYVFHLVGDEKRTFLCPHRLWSEVVRTLNLDGSFPYVLELTLQVFPSLYSTLLPENASTFNYLLKQIKRKYFSELSNINNKEKAAVLGCLELRALMKGRDASSKAALEVAEKHGGYATFFPPCLLSHYKKSQLKKFLVEELRKLSSLSAEKADFKFLEVLRELSDFECIKVPCSLGAGLASVEAELVMSPKEAISLRIENSTHLKRVGDFCDVADIQIEGRTQSVRIAFAGKEQDPLVLTFASIDDAEFAAHLIEAYRQDGSDLGEGDTILHNGCFYCVLYNDESVYDGEDYADFQYGSSAEDLPFRELPRHQIVLERMLGEGQFGDVYRGTMREGGGQEDVSVAVKTCKDSQDELSTQKFLQEAITMSQFDHPHIIRLIGVIKEKPIWIVMELAGLGELRPYMIRNADSLDSASLLMFCYQISSALCYLEIRHIVHRDIAARNVLVSSKVCVKLADFGLTRWLDTNSAYTASQGKLPLKWMAPESIHLRRFSSASDVWMFAVCMWEILQLGVKPFHGVKNNDAILLIEGGKRLEQPDRCPDSVYSLMLRCWTYDAPKRPSFAQVKAQLFDMMNELRQEKPPVAAMPRSPSVPGRSGALPPPPKPLNPKGDVRMEDIINQSLPSLHILDPPPAPQTQPAMAPIRKDAVSKARPEHSLSASNPSIPMGAFSPQGVSRPPTGALPPVPGSPQPPSDYEGAPPLAQPKPEPPKDSATSPVLRRLPERSKSFDNKRVLGAAVAAAPVDCRRSYSLEQVSVPGPEDGAGASPQNGPLARNTDSPPGPVAAPKPEVDVQVTLEDLYACVVSVVKAVHSLNARVSAVSAAECARLVRDIGQKLRMLEAAAEVLIQSAELPEGRRNDIRLARSVLTSDFADLFKAFKLAQGAENIPRLYRDYCVEVLQKAHALAIDSRQVYEAATKPRSASFSAPASSE